MARFALVRLAHGVAVVIVVTAGAWLLLRALRPDAFPPGGPVVGGLARYLAGAFLRFDLGSSEQPGRPPVAELIAEGLPSDLLVLGGATAVGLLLGAVGGGFCAAHAGTPPARALEALAVLCVCMPVYVLGLGLLLLFGAGIALVDVGIAIPIEYVRPSQDPVRWLASIVTPWLVLSLPLAGLSLRAMRGGMLETLGEDYVRAAMAKGLAQRIVLRRHVAPVAAGSTLALAGASMNLVMLTNLVLVERVFRIPGVFARTQPAVERGDVPLLLGLVIVATAVVVVASVLVDLALAWLDPRVRIR